MSWRIKYLRDDCVSSQKLIITHKKLVNIRGSFEKMHRYDDNFLFFSKIFFIFQHLYLMSFQTTQDHLQLKPRKKGTRVKQEPRYNGFSQP